MWNIKLIFKVSTGKTRLSKIFATVGWIRNYLDIIKKKLANRSLWRFKIDWWIATEFSSEMAVSNVKAKAAQASVLKVHNIHRHWQGKHEHCFCPFLDEKLHELLTKDNFYWASSGEICISPATQQHIQDYDYEFVILWSAKLREKKMKEEDEKSLTINWRWP